MLKIKELKIVEKFKAFISIALIVILAGAIVMIARGGMNTGLDFTGGAEVEVELGTNATQKLDEVKTHIEKDIIEGTEAGSKLALKLGGETRISNDDDTILTFRLAYYLDGEVSSDKQSEFLAQIRDDLTSSITDYLSELDEDFLASNVNVHATTATTAKTALVEAIIAISVAIVAMLIYIAIRFKPVAGLAAVLALAHDVLVMFALTTIFWIEVNSTFIAAIITIIGYSINATIVLFDRIRELEKSPSCQGMTDSEMVNKAIKNTLTRSIFTTLTTLITIVFLAVFGVSSIREFALPIIFGLLAGAYSSILLSGSIWVLLRKVIKPKKNTATK